MVSRKIVSLPNSLKSFLMEYDGIPIRRIIIRFLQILIQPVLLKPCRNFIRMVVKAVLCGGNEGKMGNKFLDGTALTIAIIGAINWALIGLFRFDLVAFIFGNMSWFSRIVYTIVGICGLYLISFFMHLSDRHNESAV